MKSKIMFLMAAALCFVACSKNEPVAPGQKVIINATVDNGSANGPKRVKTTNPDAATVNFQWEEGDQVVLTSGGESQTFTIINSSIAGNSANFEGTALANMSSYTVSYNLNSETVFHAAYVEGSFKPIAEGTGNKDGFTINSYKPVLHLKLTGAFTLGKIEYYVGGVLKEDMTIGGGLVLNSTAKHVYMPIRDLSATGFTLKFYDNSNNLVMEKTTAKALSAGSVFTFPEVEVVAAPAHAYVDLGLSVKWATCNLGASSPEQYGLYFAWGETVGYADASTHSFDWSHYKWMAEGYTEYDGINKYTFADDQDEACWYDGEGGPFIGDNKTALDAADDAATAIWGSGWRMPTHAEQEELRQNCTLAWTDNYNGTGVKGIVLTSKKAGYTDKSIFLPAAGYCVTDRKYKANELGYYWSSSLNSGYYTDIAYYMDFNTKNLFDSDNDYSRNYGFTIRAVQP